MLSVAEQENLYVVIEAVLGSDAALRDAKRYYNEQTVEIVEQMVEANATCNANMKELVTELLSGGRMMAKGWLRKAISHTRTHVKHSGAFRGYGCQVTTKSHWKSAILTSYI